MIAGHPKALFTACVGVFAFGALYLCSQLNAQTQSRYDAPKIPYEDPGACPFECCKYQEWIVNTETILREGTKKAAPVAFRVRKGENVQGLTGVVITTKPGKVKPLKAFTLDADSPVQVPAGAIIYVLHHEGEGYYLIWFKGKTYAEELDAEVIGIHGNLEVLELPGTIWWVKIKNRTGQIGWTNETEHFDNMDGGCR